MKPTVEQVDILDASKTESKIIINARAGAGKSTTLKMVAVGNPDKNILYVVFSKKLADEANDKFPANTDARTLYSVAYQFTGHDLAHKLNYRDAKYVNRLRTGREIANALKIPAISSAVSADALPPHVIGVIVKRTVDRFEQSAKPSIDSSIVSRRLTEKYAEKYGVSQHVLADKIVGYAQQLWEKRINPHDVCAAYHGTYAKVFQLQKRKLLNFDCILVDEFQDVNDCFMDIIDNQDHCQRILVGDDKQEIMQFAGANSALQRVMGYSTYYLTQSFRFGEEIAHASSLVFEEPIKISGVPDKPSFVDEVDQTKPHTMIFRTNAGLIVTAIDLITDGVSVNIETDTRGFCNQLRSARALYAGDEKGVKDQFIGMYADWATFRADAVEEPEYNRVAKIVEEGRDSHIIRMLEQYHDNDDDALVTLITAHKSKGGQWENVILAEDFPDPYNEDGEFVKPAPAEENLLYVALTRAEERVQPNSLYYKLIAEHGNV